MAPLPRDHTPSERCANRRDEAYNSVMTTALEGGIGYWSRCSRYLWTIGDDAHTEARDFIAVIHEMGDDYDEDTAPVHVIDREVIVKGIANALDKGGWNDYHRTALNDLRYGNWDDLDFDADTADLIVQFGLFGEQVYA